MKLFKKVSKFQLALIAPVLFFTLFAVRSVKSAKEAYDETRATVKDLKESNWLND